jgi:hypothetical protein
MTRQHTAHKLLLLLILLAAFCIPFVLTGSDTSSTAAVLQAGAGILRDDEPVSSSSQASTAEAWRISQSAGSSLH